ncbi:hypothetical protein LY625_09910 [Lysobacter sp. GX 14042]|uniref:hypothetical protein n=1 Tax=Lysobacter sp. GX 14042 TaxID=2907155 RepID=UPI001F1FE69E|nr:hypothetical protein [Lysobacter sp. GX 14042]MCE7032922.1 hypothetical protein [Lysobacter sp. GX 14042]
MSWLIEHRQLITLLVNVGMLVVWITYLQVFLAGFRRQRKPTILINVGQNRGLDAHCLVTNMSAEPIYIHALVAILEGPGGVVTCPVTELDGEDWSGPSDLRLWTRQGPLASAQIRDMGTMKAIIDHARKTISNEEGDPQAIAELRTLEIQVIAVYGSEDLPVAARRRFDLVRGDDGEPALRPQTYAARQIRSRRERRQIARTLADGPPRLM